jgi:hypothetical protein
MVIPTMAPRSTSCWVCKHVSAVEDVTVRLFGEDMTALPPSEAIRYLRSIGLTGSQRAFRWRVATHARHVGAFVRAPHDLAPIATKIVTVPEGGPTTWIDLQQQHMNVGMDALGLIAARMPDMEDKDLIGVAKLGLVASSKRADLEAKGRQLNQVDALLKIASGFSRPDK